MHEIGNIFVLQLLATPKLFLISSQITMKKKTRRLCHCEPVMGDWFKMASIVDVFGVYSFVRIFKDFG